MHFHNANAKQRMQIHIRLIKSRFSELLKGSRKYSPRCSFNDSISNSVFLYFSSTVNSSLTAKKIDKKNITKCIGKVITEVSKLRINNNNFSNLYVHT